ncbi:DinB family protein [Isoptericola aurantiacus]|uniref:DinB family protein n=1 Tax=Isoptericola aurantiacus TaxID=3377839 RepID=UPI00383BA935
MPWPDALERTEPPLRADESTTLRAFLDYHRDTLRRKAAGLTAEQLRTPLPPTTMTLGGLLKHLAYVESNWFLVVLDGGDPLPPFDTVDWSADPDWEWHSAATDSPADLQELLDQAVAASDRVLDAALVQGGLDQLAARESRHGDGAFSLRWILVHLIEEYARHNGHADLLREALDGATGE